MELATIVAEANSKESLCKFINLLSDDFDREPESWENVTVRHYLSALSAWLNDSDGYYRNQGLPIPDTPTWKSIAEMLIAAKIYE